MTECSAFEQPEALRGRGRTCHDLARDLLLHRADEPEAVPAYPCLCSQEEGGGAGGEGRATRTFSAQVIGRISTAQGSQLPGRQSCAGQQWQAARVQGSPRAQHRPAACLTLAVGRVLYGR